MLSPLHPIPNASTSRLLPLHLKLFHQVFSDSPHASTLAINIHGYREEQTTQLNAAEREEDRLSTVAFQPAVEEEGKHQTVENVCFDLR